MPQICAFLIETTDEKINEKTRTVHIARKVQLQLKRIKKLLDLAPFRAN
jgi:hypothetical protein